MVTTQQFALLRYFYTINTTSVHSFWVRRQWLLSLGHGRLACVGGVWGQTVLRHGGVDGTAQRLMALGGVFVFLFLQSLVAIAFSRAGRGDDVDGGGGGGGDVAAF